MAKIDQVPKGFSETDMREPKKESMERDERNGWDHKAGTKDGKSVSYAIFDGPVKSKKLIYVKMGDGSFKFSPRPDPNPLSTKRPITLPHSMLGKGEKVIGAGECETNADGKIIHADNHSGHYQPNEKNMKETKKNMEQQGLATSNASFKAFDRAGNTFKPI